MTNYDRLKEYEEHKEPLPSYEKYNELVQKMHILEERLEVSEKAHYKTLEQLRIATKALRIATGVLKDLELANDIRICMKAQEALTKMEGVK